MPRTGLTLGECREAYAREVCAKGGVSSAAMQAAFSAVRREEFLGSGPWLIIPVREGDARADPPAAFTTDDPRSLYDDVLVSIDSSRGLNNGQPSALAQWIDALELKSGDRVFQAGCGTGYYTAVLAELVGSGGHVVAAEIDQALAARATQNLTAWPQVAVQAVDAVEAATGMCNAMLINAGVTQPRPAWLGHLEAGGRMVAPITSERGENGGNGIMVKITHSESGFPARILSYVSIYPCGSARDPKLEPVVAKALRTRRLLRIRSVRVDAHALAGTCLVHGPGVCLSEEEPRSPGVGWGFNQLS